MNAEQKKGRVRHDCERVQERPGIVGDPFAVSYENCGLATRGVGKSAKGIERRRDFDISDGQAHIDRRRTIGLVAITRAIEQQLDVLASSNRREQRRSASRFASTRRLLDAVESRRSLRDVAHSSDHGAPFEERTVEGAISPRLKGLE
jgi:hypothetical protein